ncbi:MAG: hypothetical protein PSV36_00155 [Algoriphagus sp.]|nr:hypothetical protein [Algoriphagus sp.]
MKSLCFFRILTLQFSPPVRFDLLKRDALLQLSGCPGTGPLLLEESDISELSRSTQDQIP